MRLTIRHRTVDIRACTRNKVQKNIQNIYKSLNIVLIPPVHADHARCYVSPELSQVEKIKITGFPSDGKHNIVPGTTVDFLIIKNGAPGNIAVHVIPPNGLVTSQQRSHIDVIELSPDSYVAHVPVTEIGTYTVHVRFNDVELPRSPLTFRSGSCL